MKDFQLRKDTKLLFRNDPVADLTAWVAGKKVLFVYGGGSVKTNGCHDDVKTAVEKGNAVLLELDGASRELADIERGIAMVRQHGIDLVIGAGGASVMDCAKLVAFGTFHDDLWDYVKGRKNPYGEPKLPLLLMPTYPSSGSEYGLGAVSADRRTGDFGTAYGIAADVALLVPKYALSLSAEMTAYTGLVPLVQLSAATIGDRNPMSYAEGIADIRNVLAATRRLKENPADLDARGVILYGAAISTSSRLGLGKEENYAYEIYELEFVPEVLFNAPYRKSLTTIFPHFLTAMAKYHEADIRTFLKDAFGLDDSLEVMEHGLVRLFTELGVGMHFSGEATIEQIRDIDINTSLTREEVLEVIKNCLN